MLLALQFTLASLLVVGGVGIVGLWLLLLAMSYDGQSGLMPWVGAGVILYGLVFVALGSFIGVPGILWANHLVKQTPARWKRAARVPGLIGSAVLVIGLVTGIAVLVVESSRPKDPRDGQVTYTAPPASPEASSAVSNKPAAGEKK